MENEKDRLPRDLYINEPELKFNTCGRARPATRVGFFEASILTASDGVSKILDQ
jgi:hypothetical protein